MPYCSVFGCSNNKGTHRFPNRDNSPVRFNQWTNFCKRKHFKPTNNSVICSHHFKSQDFDDSDILKQKLLGDKYKSRAPRLKSGTVPTIFVINNDKSSDGNTTTKKSRSERIKNQEKKDMVENLIAKKSNIDSYDHNKNEEKLSCSEDNISDIEENVSFTDNDFYDDPDFECENEEEDYTEEFDNVENTDIKYCLVFINSLLTLFTICNICKSKIINKKWYAIGATICVRSECSEGHSSKWFSQPVKKQFSKGHVHIATSILLSGTLFTTFKVFCSSLKLVMFSRATYDKIMNKYSYRLIEKIWEKKRTEQMNYVKESGQLWIAGDGQYDSPGFCAKYCTYTFMDINSGCIVDFQLIQKKMMPGDLEKNACKQLIDKLIGIDKCKIDLLLTDRHVGIRHLLKTSYPDITHEFDLWHLSKSLMKKFKTINKKYEEVLAWKQSISNHLWWSAQTCNGDSDLLITKFTSILKHIKNVHEWEEDGVKKTCEHPPLSDEYKKQKLWLLPDSKPYEVLKEIICNKKFLTDLKQTKNYVHTGRLESYHNLRLKYVPKRVHFSFKAMYIKSIIAIIDHNSNLNKKKIGLNYLFSKPTGKWVTKNIYEKGTNNWRDEIINTILDHLNGVEMSPLKTPLNVTLPKNIAPIDRPALEIMQNSHHSRFLNIS